MSDGLLLLVLTLATYRVWRIIGLDALFDRQRAWVLAHLPGKIDYGVTCVWCSGWWIAGLCVFIVDRWYVHLAAPVLWWLAVSCGAGLIGHNLDGE